ncbi:hypothetical protein QBZ16_000587 [Prototheca wickerhamii]|uniref:Inner centromere protein ARK-binding domain-containing protein n=1 Tax=Prototheca wickerhamii TaxID=3111 RepID=A0AAD9MN55_PROWI|nr:hypothetical protein QBZ16_000587 [Prototheca wickerhamii]
MASNLVSAVRSLLPLGGSGPDRSAPFSFLAASAGGPGAQPKPAARVAALEKAEAARKAQEAREAERERRKQELERLKAERLATKAAAEAEAAATRAEQAQRKQREAAARRQQLQLEKQLHLHQPLHGVKKARVEGGDGLAAPVVGASSNAAAEKPAATGSAPASKPLKKILYQGQGASDAPPPKLRLGRPPPRAERRFWPGKPADAARPAFPRLVLNPLAANAQGPSSTAAAIPSEAATPDKQGRPRTSSHGSQHQYEISPYSDEDSSEGDDGPSKPVPEWAKGKRLQEQLVHQMRVDPDEIFQHQHKTCTLDEMFEKQNNGQRDFSRRTSTGNWAEDRLTWQEELRYKKAMGFI